MGFPLFLQLMSLFLLSQLYLNVLKSTFLLIIPFCVLLETLRNYFSQYGEVVDCVIMKDKSTNQSRGFGFVKFKDPNCVRTVLDTKPHNLDGRNVRRMTDNSTLPNHNDNCFTFKCSNLHLVTPKSKKSALMPYWFGLI